MYFYFGLKDIKFIFYYCIVVFFNDIIIGLYNYFCILFYSLLNIVKYE